MGLSICPIATIAAPIELVWANLVEWDRYYEWADTYVERLEPEGAAVVGQIVHFAGKALGRIWRFTFEVEEINPERHMLDLHVFPIRTARETSH
jgi:hypothetical protein